MSWNSTHTALASITAIVLMAMYQSIDLEAVFPFVAAIGAYAGIRERKRMQEREIEAALGQ